MRKYLACSASLLVLVGCSSPSAELICPTTDTGQKDGTLRETHQQIAMLGDSLGSASESEIQQAVARLRSRHPKASEAEIVNVMVTAYCPTIKANPALSRSAKQKTLKTFAARIEAIARKP